MVVELVVGGAFDDLPPDEPYVALSLSRAGFAGSHEIAKMDLADPVEGDGDHVVSRAVVTVECDDGTGGAVRT